MNDDALQIKIKDDTKRFKVAAVFLAAAVVLRLLVSGLEDAIIVYAGVRLFGTLSLILNIATVIAGVVFILFLALMLIHGNEQKKQEAMNEADSHQGPVLKVKGELDPVQIRDNLIAESDKWLETISQLYPKERGEMSTAITGVKETMVQMDDYQLRLKNLLDNNGADALRDTEEVLDRVEQHICRNVRKLLNIMTVSSPKTQNDIDVVKLTATNCAEDNRRLLKTTKEFMVAITEFLNSQGDGDSSISEIEVYKKALASQIEEGGIY